MADTRDLVVAAWRASRREANVNGIVRLNHASAAGWLLEQADGDTEDALTTANNERLRWDWFGPVVGYLARIVVEEREARAERAAE